MLNDQEFSALAEQYMDMVYRIALTCVRHPADAEDVTQNTMLRLYRWKGSFQSPEHARRWLTRVTINESKRLLTSPWRARTLSLEELTFALPAQSSEERDILQAVLALPKKYRLPLYLYYYEGYKVEEISALLKRNPSTVQTHLARGREKLKAALEEVLEHG
jgi:RNA polymerase sigma factor (sigma-70 family)